MELIRLFNEKSFSEHLNNINQEIKELLKQDYNKIINADSHSLAMEYRENYKISCPVFDFDKTKAKLIAKETMYYEIPFNGDYKILKCRSENTSCKSPGSIEVSLHSDKIDFRYINNQGTIQNEGMPKERLLRDLESIKEFIECSIESLSKSINTWNDEITEILYRRISNIKEQFENEKKLSKQISDNLNPFKNNG